jgi:hypothetical protein
LRTGLASSGLNNIHEPNQSSGRHRSAAYNGQDACQAARPPRNRVRPAIYRKNRSTANLVATRNTLHKTALRWIANYGLRSKISSFQ